MKRGIWKLPAMLFAVSMSASVALAQPAGGQGDPGGGGAAAAASATPDRIRAQLGSNEEEWAVLAPKVQALLAAYYRVQSGLARGGTATSAVARALQDLRDILDNPNASPQQINEKLTALRELRTRAQATFAAAQKSLQELLTIRQEATMVVLDYFE